MKQKPAYTKKRGWHHKSTPFILLASALIVGFVFAQNGNLGETSKKTPPKIDSISPTTVVGGNEITVTGSGFTKEEDYTIWRRKDVEFYPGNHYQIRGKVFVTDRIFSPDGKTLKFRLTASSEVLRDCKDWWKPGSICEVPLQILNGWGLSSNVKHVKLYYPEKALQAMYGLDPQTPPSQNISIGAADVEVLRYRAAANSQNLSDQLEITGAVVWLPTDEPVNCSETFRNLKLFDGSNQIGIEGEAWAINYKYYYTDPPLQPGTCAGGFNLNNMGLTLAPGTEKVLSFKLSIPSTAKVGTVFRPVMGIALFSSLLLEVDEHYDFGNPMTIIAP